MWEKNAYKISNAKEAVGICLRRKGYEKPVTNTVLLYTEANKMDEEVWLAAIENKVLGKYFIAIP